MKKLERMAVDWIRSQIGTGEGFIVNHSDTHVEDGAKAAYIAGFRAAREMAADLLDHALKWACIEVDQHDRRLLDYQVKRITQLGEEEVK